MTNNSKYELVVVAVNQGFTDSIMDVARKAGAKGGTIIQARASANEKAEKDYGVVVTHDKELLLILVEDKVKNAVINAIYKTAGIETQGMGIICSIPADNVVGLNKLVKKVKPAKKNKK